MSAPTGITLRRAVPADATAIGAVFDNAVRAGWTYLPGLADEPMFTPRDWDNLVADHAPPNTLLVAVDPRDGVIGFTAVHPDDGELFLLFVDPAHAGRGVGRVLLAAAHDALRAAGRTEAYLFTHEHNERALRRLHRGRLPHRRHGTRVRLPRHPTARTPPGQASLADSRSAPRAEQRRAARHAVPVCYARRWRPSRGPQPEHPTSARLSGRSRCRPLGRSRKWIGLRDRSPPMTSAPAYGLKCLGDAVAASAGEGGQHLPPGRHVRPSRQICCGDCPAPLVPASVCGGCGAPAQLLVAPPRDGPRPSPNGIGDWGIGRWSLLR